MRDNNIYYKTYISQLEEAGITPAQEMEEVIDILEQNEITKPNAETLKIAHTNATKGETTFKIGRKKRTFRDVLNDEACDVIEKASKNQPGFVGAIIAMNNRLLYWCYLELEAIDARLMEGAAYN